MSHTPTPMRRANSRRIKVASDKLTAAVKESCAELTRFMLVHVEAEGKTPAHDAPHPDIANFVHVAGIFRDIVQTVLHPPAPEPEPEPEPDEAPV